MTCASFSVFASAAVLQTVYSQQESTHGARGHEAAYFDLHTGRAFTVHQIDAIQATANRSPLIGSGCYMQLALELLLAVLQLRQNHAAS